MKQNSFFKKRIIHVYVIIFIIVLVLLTAGILMFKYHVEGEKNMPFNLKSISVMSTAQTEDIKNEGDTWKANLIQKNDIYFAFEKNSNYKKQDTIKKIKFCNFVINKETENGTVVIYRPSTNELTYNYKNEEYIVNDSLEYEGALSTNPEVLQISNQGGIVGFSILQKDIGEYTYNKEEKIVSDGKLLEKAGIDIENVKLEVSFDVIIETTLGYNFKSNVKLDLPTGNILQDGVSTKEDSELTNVIFKRF